MNFPPLAIIRTSSELLSALRDRRIALGLSQLDLDHRAGLQDGYTGKIEAWKRTARTSGRCYWKLGPETLPLVLSALGLVLTIAEDPDTRRPS